MFSPTLRSFFEKEYGIKVGYGSYGGCFKEKVIPSGVTFGNYCSVAPNIRIFRANHPKENFTSHPILYNPICGYMQDDQLERPELLIGHDVWLGEWSMIMPSVKRIGNGAMIGAGAIVTKDVDPYSIVAGSPAKVIGQRFSQQVIEKLEKTEWWEMEKDVLIQKIPGLTDIIKEKT